MVPQLTQPKQFDNSLFGRHPTEQPLPRDHGSASTDGHLRFNKAGVSFGPESKPEPQQKPLPKFKPW